MFSKLLWLEKSLRTENEPAISFLCTRVINITKEEKAKLRQVLQFLRHKIGYKRIMEEDIISRIWSKPQTKEPHLWLHEILIWDGTFQVHKAETEHKGIH